MVALKDPLLGEAVRRRLETEPDVAVLGITSHLAQALDAGRGPLVDVLVLGSALLAHVPEETLSRLTDIARSLKVVLLAAPFDASAHRWAAALRSVEVVSQLESPSCLVAVIRSITR